MAPRFLSRLMMRPVSPMRSMVSSRIAEDATILGSALVLERSSFRRIAWQTNIFGHIALVFAKNATQLLASRSAFLRRWRHEDRDVLSLVGFGLEPRQRPFSAGRCDGIHQTWTCRRNLLAPEQLERLESNRNA